MQAIVLSRQDFKEFDQIVSLYTREEGRRDVLARGIKKIVSKNAAHLEPCSFVEVGIAKGKDMDIVTSVQIENYFPNIRKNYYKSLLGMWAMEKVKLFFSSPEKDERMFACLVSWLQFLEEQSEISPYLLDALMLRMLGYLGFTPVVDQCVECEKSRSGEVFIFSPARGGILCSDCQKNTVANGEKLYRVSLEILEMIEMLLFSPWDKVASLSPLKKSYGKVHSLVFLFLRYNQEKECSDWLKLAKLSRNVE
jgi:DNA repair protein RecO (recombination protein O)